MGGKIWSRTTDAVLIHLAFMPRGLGLNFTLLVDLGFASLIKIRLWHTGGKTVLHWHSLMADLALKKYILHSNAFNLEDILKKRPRVHSKIYGKIGVN